jgi:transcriptional regulator with XRE-family HTH domain
MFDTQLPTNQPLPVNEDIWLDHGKMSDMPNSKASSAGVDKRWFQNLFSDKRIAQAQLAKVMGIHAPALTRILNGERRLQMEEAIDMARILDISLDEILTHAGLSPSTDGPTATIRGTVLPDNSIEPTVEKDRTPAPQEGLSALENKRLKWMLFYKPSSTINPDAIGRMAMITTAKEENPRLAFVERGSRAGVYDLRDPTTDVLTRDVALTSASPVLFIRT